MAGTRAVRNGDPRVHDIKFGALAKAALAVIVILSAAGVQRAFVISNKIDVLDERQIAAQRERQVLADSIRALKEDLDYRQARADVIHEGFMTHAEFRAWLDGRTGPGR